MQEAVVEALSILLPTAATVLAVMAVGWIRERIGVEGMEQVKMELYAKQELARLAVRSVEQVYRDIGGQKKLDHALNWLGNQFKDKGFKLDDDEMRGLIEAALREMKDAFGEEWAKQLDREDGG